MVAFLDVKDKVRKEFMIWDDRNMAHFNSFGCE